MKCRLCQLVNKIETMNHTIKPWTKKLITEDGTVINLKGTEYQFKDNNEVIRHIDDEIILINSLRRYADDGIICLSRKHMTNEEAINNGTLTRAYNKIMSLIKEQHNGSSRVMHNIGKRFASIPEHFHIQIIYSTTTDIYIPPMNKDYLKEKTLKKQ